jgi:hypothetical protein
MHGQSLGWALCGQAWRFLGFQGVLGTHGEIPKGIKGAGFMAASPLAVLTTSKQCAKSWTQGFSKGNMGGSSPAHGRNRSFRREGWTELAIQARGLDGTVDALERHFKIALLTRI